MYCWSVWLTRFLYYVDLVCYRFPITNRCIKFNSIQEIDSTELQIYNYICSRLTSYCSSLRISGVLLLVYQYIRLIVVIITFIFLHWKKICLVNTRSAQFKTVFELYISNTIIRFIQHIVEEHKRRVASKQNLFSLYLFVYKFMFYANIVLVPVITCLK